MSLNIPVTRNLLQAFDFQTLFREELGWNNPASRAAFPFQTKSGATYSRRSIAELSGATVFEVTSSDGAIPGRKEREEISALIQKVAYEHILIFIDQHRSQTIWRWLKKEGKKTFSREHLFSKGQTGDAFIGKLSGLLVDLAEIEANITITDVAKKMQAALDVERVTKKFYGEYQEHFIAFTGLIEGIDNEADRRWYASVLLNRLMFIYFLQEKGFLNSGDRNYLWNKYMEVAKSHGKNKYYAIFLKALFFEGFAKPASGRDAATNKLLGSIRYLNGGLFLEHRIEEKYRGKISIPDSAFAALLSNDEPKGLFERFSWSLDDTPGGKDNEINPNVLGYIFEKYINQKAFGAYYTRPEITEYLCEQTVYKLILDAVNGPENDSALLKKAGLGKIPAPRRYHSIADLLLNLDAATCRKLLLGTDPVLPGLSLLDPACGSGAFLVAAMKTLINVYAAILGKIDFLGDKKLSDWKAEIAASHASINYYIKRQIITNNLYGVDIMEEATEIARLRLFLALVASAETEDQLEPLPNIDFNIIPGNSLIGLMRVDSSRFDKHYQKPAPKGKGAKVVATKSLFNEAVGQFDLFSSEHAKSYQQLINEREAAIAAYKNAQNLDQAGLQGLRDSIQDSEAAATKILNELLLEEFNGLGIKHEAVTWDAVKGKENKSAKRPLTLEDMAALEPFHWGYEFSQIFRKKDGFDAIITNSPWDIFKPNGKEFFAEHSSLVTKKKMNIKDFEKIQKALLKDPEIQGAWEEYLTRFPHVSLYYRNAVQFRNQISVVNGKKIGSDIDFYKLFTEQCYNLLRKGGYAGIVSSGGISNTLGSKQLRAMLFDNCTIGSIINLSNEKFIFEEVHHAQKFTILTFRSGGKTEKFNAAFRINPRVAISPKDLESFLYNRENLFSINTAFVKKQSPDSLSVMEVNSHIELQIAEKMLAFPLLGADVGSWKLKLSAEFHMTNDSYLFKTTSGTNKLPLYEGKMVWQFGHQYAEPKYWVNEPEGREAISGKKDAKAVCDYQRYRVGLRAVAASTNERTIVSSVIPKMVFCGNSLLVSKGIIDKRVLLSDADSLFVVSILNSFLIDYYARQMVTTNINMFYVYQLPVPRLSPSDFWYRPIVEKAALLICTTEEFAELWEEVMGNKWSENKAATSEADRAALRAELDGIIAHIYGLSEDEFAYILSTFPIVPQAAKDAALQAYKTLAPQFGSATEQEERVRALIAAGESATVEFKPSIVSIKGGKSEKFFEQAALKTIAAFLNSNGGTLLIGVADNREVLGLETDFASFKKDDKQDEFLKHFDNLISAKLGNRFQRYLDVSFVTIEGATVCAIVVPERSAEPVFIKGEGDSEEFYIRRTASTVALKPSESHKYIKEHWMRTPIKLTTLRRSKLTTCFAGEEKGFTHEMSDV